MSIDSVTVRLKLGSFGQPVHHRNCECIGRAFPEVVICVDGQVSVICQAGSWRFGQNLAHVGLSNPQKLVPTRRCPSAPHFSP